jgi:hypothetical protein
MKQHGWGVAEIADMAGHPILEENVSGVLPEGLTPERGSARVQKLTKRASLYLVIAEGSISDSMRAISSRRSSSTIPVVFFFS